MMQGDRVFIRPLERTDIPSLFQFNQRIEMSILQAGLPRPLSIRVMEEHYEKRIAADERRNYFAIVTESGFSGSTSLVQSRDSSDVFTYGVIIGLRECWGKGYGTETTILMVHHAFNDLGARRLQLMTNSKNPRAIRCFEKSGFIHEGRERETNWIDGEYADTVWMSILRKEWEVRNA